MNRVVSVIFGGLLLTAIFAALAWVGYQKVLVLAAGCEASTITAKFCNWYIYLAANPFVYVVITAVLSLIVVLWDLSRDRT